MTLYMLSRVLGAIDRKSQMVVPVRAFKDMKTAQEAAQLRTQALREVMQCRLVDAHGGDTGIGLSEFVQNLGIHGFQHVVDPIEVHGGDLLLPEAPSIILAR